MKLQDFIEYFEKQCGDEDSYSVALKPHTWRKMRNKIIDSLENRINIANSFYKGYYKGVEVSVFPNGRLIFKKVPNEEYLISILNELLDSSS